MKKTDQRLKALGIQLPPCPKPAAKYVPAVRCGSMVHVAGQTPKKGDRLVYKGKLGRDLELDQGVEAARLCALRLLSALEWAAGGLDGVKRIVRLRGYVNATEAFSDHSKVIDGASDLLVAVLGERGAHARVAVGVSSLPGGAAVEIELDAEVEDN